MLDGKIQRVDGGTNLAKWLDTTRPASHFIQTPDGPRTRRGAEHEERRTKDHGMNKDVTDAANQEI